MPQIIMVNSTSTRLVDSGRDLPGKKSFLCLNTQALNVASAGGAVGVLLRCSFTAARAVEEGAAAAEGA